MTPRTIGIEEELLLVDPDSRQLSPRSQQVLRPDPDDPSGAALGDLDKELFRHQLETRTAPSADLAELRSHVVRQRQAAAAAAARAGVATIASGTCPVASGEPQISPDDRYRTLLHTYGEVARLAGICGMHVHVQVDSDEQGVAVIDAIAPWLPVALAISANSPYAQDRDTRYHSWRSQMWARFPSAGPTERFGSLAAYREVSRRMLESGAALDEGMLYFDARLSADHPTVEVRVADVCTDPDDAVLIAALVRGLVMRAVADGADETPGIGWRAEMLRAAHWRAARYGLSERLLCPTTARPTAAREVLSSLVAKVRDPLEACGDLELVEAGVDRVLAGGGASRQHAAYERSGGDVAAVVDDLVVRTNRCWKEHDGN